MPKTDSIALSSSFVGVTMSIQIALVRLRESSIPSLRRTALSSLLYT
jgi:hypothetical protein